MINYRDIAKNKNTVYIAVFGGAFNPIHFGHLRLAKDILEILSLDRIIFVPSGKDHSKDDLAEEKHRAKMIELSISEEPDFETCLFEIGKKEFITSDKTVKYIQENMSESYNNIQLFFLCGSDTLKRIINWPTFRKLIEISFLLITKRPGFEIENYVYKNKLYQSYSERFIVFDRQYEDFLSSRIIRNRIKDGLSLQYFVTDQVRNYIRKNKLYQ